MIIIRCELHVNIIYMTIMNFENVTVNISFQFRLQFVNEGSLIKTVLFAKYYSPKSIRRELCKK